MSYPRSLSHCSLDHQYTLNHLASHLKPLFGYKSARTSLFGASDTDFIINCRTGFMVICVSKVIRTASQCVISLFHGEQISNFPLLHLKQTAIARSQLLLCNLSDAFTSLQSLHFVKHTKGGVLVSFTQAHCTSFEGSSK